MQDEMEVQIDDGTPDFDGGYDDNDPPEPESEPEQQEEEKGQPDEKPASEPEPQPGDDYKSRYEEGQRKITEMGQINADLNRRLADVERKMGEAPKEPDPEVDPEVDEYGIKLTDEQRDALEDSPEIADIIKAQRATHRAEIADLKTQVSEVGNLKERLQHSDQREAEAQFHDVMINGVGEGDAKQAGHADYQDFTPGKPQHAAAIEWGKQRMAMGDPVATFVMTAPGDAWMNPVFFIPFIAGYKEHVATQLAKDGTKEHDAARVKQAKTMSDAAKASLDTAGPGRGSGAAPLDDDDFDVGYDED